MRFDELPEEVQRFLKKQFPDIPDDAEIEAIGGSAEGLESTDSEDAHELLPRLGEAVNWCFESGHVESTLQPEASDIINTLIAMVSPHFPASSIDLIQRLLQHICCFGYYLGYKRGSLPPVPEVFDEAFQEGGETEDGVE